MTRKSTGIGILFVVLVVSVACGEAGADPTPAQLPAATEPTEQPSSTPEQQRVQVSFDVGPCAMTRAAQLPIEFEFQGTIPTGFDGINQANCTFTKPVETITLMLTGPATHTEMFTLTEPTSAVSFPLPEDTLSISTLEIVPPGEYQREITAASVDDDTVVVSDQPGVLKTITILEPAS